MTTPRESSTRRERSTIYILVAVMVAILMVIGLIAYRGQKETEEAEQKADEFIAALEQAGARVPSREQVVRVLGDDGGAVCANPNDALSRSALLVLMTNGASGPGIRPVLADSKVIQGELLVIKVYCPDELEEFQQFVDDLNLNDKVAG
jgi:Tfp pilus assembly protein FimT